MHIYEDARTLGAAFAAHIYRTLLPCFEDGEEWCCAEAGEEWCCADEAGSAENPPRTGTASPQDAGTPLRGPPFKTLRFIGIFRGRGA